MPPRYAPGTFLWVFRDTDNTWWPAVVLRADQCREMMARSWLVPRDADAAVHLYDSTNSTVFINTNDASHCTLLEYDSDKNRHHRVQLGLAHAKMDQRDQARESEAKARLAERMGPNASAGPAFCWARGSSGGPKDAPGPLPVRTAPPPAASPAAAVAAPLAPTDPLAVGGGLVYSAHDIKLMASYLEAMNPADRDLVLQLLHHDGLQVGPDEEAALASAALCEDQQRNHTSGRRAKHRKHHRPAEGDEGSTSSDGSTSSRRRRRHKRRRIEPHQEEPDATAEASAQPACPSPSDRPIPPPAAASSAVVSVPLIAALPLASALPTPLDRAVRGHNSSEEVESTTASLLAAPVADGEGVKLLQSVASTRFDCGTVAEEVLRRISCRILSCNEHLLPNAASLATALCDHPALINLPPEGYVAPIFDPIWKPIRVLGAIGVAGRPAKGTLPISEETAALLAKSGGALRRHRVFAVAMDEEGQWAAPWMEEVTLDDERIGMRILLNDRRVFVAPKNWRLAVTKGEKLQLTVVPLDVSDGVLGGSDLSEGSQGGRGRCTVRVTFTCSLHTDAQLWLGVVAFVLVEELPIELVVEALAGVNGAASGKGPSPSPIRDDLQLSAESTSVSLICPVSRMQLVVPCRGTLCEHAQSMDLATFIGTCCNTHVWQCPLCSLPLPFWEVRVDHALMGLCCEASNRRAQGYELQSLTVDLRTWSYTPLWRPVRDRKDDITIDED